MEFKTTPRMKNLSENTRCGFLKDNHGKDCFGSVAHSGRRLVLKAGVAALAGALLVGCSGGGNTPEGVVKAYVTAVFEGRVDDALAMTANGEALGSKLRPMFARIPAEAAKKGGLKSVEVTSAEVKGDTATVKMTLHFKDGSSEESKRDTQLIRTDGKWKIVIR